MKLYQVQISSKLEKNQTIGKFGEISSWLNLVDTTYISLVA